MYNDACDALARLVERLAVKQPSGEALLAQMAHETAAIRPGWRGLLDLMRGGVDLIRGRGFRARFDDDSDGQARHFAGIAYSVCLIGEKLTRFVSIRIRRDAEESPDGRLTDQAIDFAKGILSSRISVAAAGSWIETHLCE